MSAVAKQMGLKSFYIDKNPVYTAEAQQRLLTAKRDAGVANDNQTGPLPPLTTSTIQTGEEP